MAIASPTIEGGFRSPAAESAAKPQLGEKPQGPSLREKAANSRLGLAIQRAFGRNPKSPEATLQAVASGQLQKEATVSPSTSEQVQSPLDSMLAAYKNGPTEELRQQLMAKGYTEAELQFMQNEVGAGIGVLERPVETGEHAASSVSLPPNEPREENDILQSTNAVGAEKDISNGSTTVSPSAENAILGSGPAVSGATAVTESTTVSGQASISRVGEDDVQSVILGQQAQGETVSIARETSMSSAVDAIYGRGQNVSGNEQAVNGSPQAISTARVGEGNAQSAILGNTVGENQPAEPVDDRDIPPFLKKGYAGGDTSAVATSSPPADRPAFVDRIVARNAELDAEASARKAAETVQGNPAENLRRIAEEMGEGILDVREKATAAGILPQERQSASGSSRPPVETRKLNDQRPPVNFISPASATAEVSPHNGEAANSSDEYSAFLREKAGEQLRQTEAILAGRRGILGEPIAPNNNSSGNVRVTEVGTNTVNNADKDGEDSSTTNGDAARLVEEIAHAAKDAQQRAAEADAYRVDEMLTAAPLVEDLAAAGGGEIKEGGEARDGNEVAEGKAETQAPKTIAEIQQEVFREQYDSWQQRWVDEVCEAYLDKNKPLGPDANGVYAIPQAQGVYEDPLWQTILAEETQRAHSEGRIGRRGELFRNAVEKYRHQKDQAAREKDNDGKEVGPWKIEGDAPSEMARDQQVAQKIGERVLNSLGITILPKGAPGESAFTSAVIEEMTKQLGEKGVLTEAEVRKIEEDTFLANHEQMARDWVESVFKAHIKEGKVLDSNIEQRLTSEQEKAKKEGKPFDIEAGKRLTISESEGMIDDPLYQTIFREETDLAQARKQGDNRAEIFRNTITRWKAEKDKERIATIRKARGEEDSVIAQQGAGKNPDNGAGGEAASEAAGAVPIEAQVGPEVPPGISATRTLNERLTDALIQTGGDIDTANLDAVYDAWVAEFPEEAVTQAGEPRIKAALERAGKVPKQEAVEAEKGPLLDPVESRVYEAFAREHFEEALVLAQENPQLRIAVEAEKARRAAGNGASESQAKTPDQQRIAQLEAKLAKFDKFAKVLEQLDIPDSGEIDLPTIIKMLQKKQSEVEDEKEKSSYGWIIALITAMTALSTVKNIVAPNQQSV